MFGVEYVVVEIGDLLLVDFGFVEIVDFGLDVRCDVVLVELWIVVDDVGWGIIVELMVYVDFFEFVIECVGFVKIIGIVELVDEVGGM